jgi:hypothetical protein
MERSTMEALQASLIPLLWLAWLIYWIVAARDARRRSASNPQPLAPGTSFR